MQGVGSGTGGTLWFAWPGFTSQVVGFLHEEENVAQKQRIYENITVYLLWFQIM